MRICHVSPHLPPDQAANALLPAQLGRLMAERGHGIAFVAHPAVLARRDGPSLGPGTSALGPGASGVGPDLPVRWIPRRRGTVLQRLLKLDAWRMVRQVNRALDDAAAGADLLHLHSNGLIVEAAAAWARRRRTPYVLTLYGTEIWHYRRRRPVDPFTRAYFGAERIAFYSRRLLDRAQTLGLDRPGLSVVYPAVAESFAPRDEPARRAARQALGIAEPLMILNVKRLHPLAGQRYLIAAFAQLAAARRDVRLVICGDGPLRDDLRRQARTLGVDDRVTLTGLLPNEAIAEHMAAADVFALPSILEALPTVAVEALASGTPVISADHPGGMELRALFGDDVAVVPRESVEPLARALREFLSQPRRTRPATAQQLDRLFRPSGMVDAYAALYAESVT